MIISNINWKNVYSFRHQFIKENKTTKINFDVMKKNTFNLKTNWENLK